MLYERTAISKKPEKTIENDIKALKSEANLSVDLVFRDPYFLDFLGLQNTYSEKDLEKVLQEKLHKSLELARNKFLITELDKEGN